MNRQQFAALLLLTLGGCGDSTAVAPAPPATVPPSPVPTTPAAAPGWTGVTEPLEVIEARRLLMMEAERQMKAIDLFTIGEPADPATLRSAAVTIEPLMLTTPHLFPPTTNLYDPAELESPTIALPAIWESFTAFEQLAVAAEEAAVAVAGATDTETLKTTGRNLRAACDACHAAYTKPYAPPQATDADRDFDFDSVLQK